jgi:ribonuclease Z
MNIAKKQNRAAESDEKFEVVLLGTGTPRPVMDRFGPSNLVSAGNQVLVFDAGRGSMQRLFQIGISFAEVNAVFLTHLHSDHIVGLPDLWLSGWLDGRREKPIRLFGPEGTSRMMKHLVKAFEYDIHIRIEDDKCSPSGAIVQVTEVQEGIVFDKGGVKVTAFHVDHRPITPSFGYRIDYAGRSVVMSGDTRFSENLIRFAKGVDLLIHEVGDAAQTLMQKYPSLARAIDHHTSAREAGEIFQRTSPGLAVYTHILHAGLKVSDLISRTRSVYSGPLLAGEDLMKFIVGDEVIVHKPEAYP